MFSTDRFAQVVTAVAGAFVLYGVIVVTLYAAPISIESWVKLFAGS